MKKSIHLLLVIIFFTVTICSQEKKHSQLNVTCKTCHACEVPTKDDPCLIACPRFTMIKEYPSPEVGPGVIIINELEDRYTPVIFSHRIHAQMSEMTGGCLGCHHYNTLGPILTCSECHSKKRKREDVRAPDLKGAFHQQCLDCHRQWSHQTECVSCHQENREGKSLDITEKTSELLLKSHPPVEKPTKIVYDTKYEEGKIVTFFHNDHAKLFGLECVSCHKNENCIKCHDLERISNGENRNYISQVKSQFTEEERHKKCFGCHENNKCSFCHKNEVMNPFDHGLRTGWALNRFHQNISCIKCHKSKTNFTRINNKCKNCHSGWNIETFNHQVTGLVLDENHSENDCEDCHIDRDFNVNPTCSNCHDNKHYPEDIPGKLIDIK